MDEYGNGKTTMPYKGYGRIFVEKQEDIDKVKLIIKEIDEYEYDYIPDDLIAVFDGRKSVKYTHKFSDLDINDLIIECWRRNIKAFYII